MDTTINTKSSLYKEWTENPEDIIEPTKAIDVFKTTPSIIPYVDPYVDEFVTEYKGKEYCNRGFYITDYTKFMKAYNELPERPKGKYWIFTKDNQWILQIKGLI